MATQAGFNVSLLHNDETGADLAFTRQAPPANPPEEDEIEFVNCIAEQLGVAIQQAKHLQIVKERSDRQRILVQAISRIRQSQDINRIFKTTAQEVRYLLDCDRVGIFITGLGQACRYAPEGSLHAG